MTTIDLQQKVRDALQTEWPQFAEAHPRLAGVMDETLLVDSIAESLAEDPDYQQAMASAEEVGAAAGIVLGVVQTLVRQWLRRLV